VQAGKLRPIAMVNKTRLPDYPNVPTMKEAGYADVGTIAWNGLFAPAGTPKPVLEALHKIVMQALASDEVKEKFAKQKMDIAPNKSLAKIASDRQKPDGLTVVPFDDPKGFLAPLPVAVIPGVGPKMQAFLTEKGIATVGELQKVSGQELLKWFGKTGVWLWGVVQAEERLAVFERDMLKSMSVERTFDEDAEGFEQVYAQIDVEARELAERVRDANVKFKVAGIKIRFKGFQTFTRETTLTGFTDSEEALRHEARVLLKEFEAKKKPVRLVGVRVSQLRREKVALTRLDEWARE